jgi:hypothetical protein
MTIAAFKPARDPAAPGRLEYSVHCDTWEPGTRSTAAEAMSAGLHHLGEHTQPLKRATSACDCWCMNNGFYLVFIQECAPGGLPSRPLRRRPGLAKPWLSSPSAASGHPVRRTPSNAQIITHNTQETHAGWPFGKLDRSIIRPSVRPVLAQTSQASICALARHVRFVRAAHRRWSRPQHKTPRKQANILLRTTFDDSSGIDPASVAGVDF